MFANGTGVFARDSSASVEPISLLLLPNIAGLVFRFKVWRDQLLTPYIEGGGGYYTFMELVESTSRSKFAGTAVGYGVGGLAIDLGYISGDTVASLDQEWGINKVSLNIEFRVVQGVSPFNLSYNNISAGLMLDY